MQKIAFILIAFLISSCLSSSRKLTNVSEDETTGEWADVSGDTNSKGVSSLPPNYSESDSEDEIVGERTDLPEDTSSESGNSLASTHSKSDSMDTSLGSDEIPGLSAAEIDILMNLELESPKLRNRLQIVLLPAYLPLGYQVIQLETSISIEDFFLYYRIVYSGNDKTCFVIDAYTRDMPSSSLNTGDAPEDFDVIENIYASAIDFEIDLGITEFSQSSSDRMIGFLLTSTAQEFGGVYSFRSPANQYCSQSIPVEHAIAITQSLRSIQPLQDNLKVMNWVD